MTETRCWCGRFWVVDSLRRQCESGDHLKTPQSEYHSLP